MPETTRTTPKSRPFLLRCLLAHAVLMPSSEALSYDVVIIGGGSAGLTAAKFASTFGKTSCIIEKAKLGGDCTWTGCVPSKTLLSAAKTASTVRNARNKGLGMGNDADVGMKVDLKAVRERVRRTVRDIYEEDDSAEVLKELGIDSVEGEARFESAKKLMVKMTGGVEDVEVLAKEGVVIATGAGPKNMEKFIRGLSDIRYVTYEQVFDLDVLPDKMTVVGGGPIGCELAQAFAKMGSEVTMIVNGLLPGKDPEVGCVLEQAFEKDGIKIIKGKVTRVQPDGAAGGKHMATFTPSEGEHCTITEVKGDIMLVAVGRNPVVRGMDLEQLGVLLNSKGGIKVDKMLQTTIKGVYAAGDCTGDRQFTHYAGYQGAIAARNVLLPFSDPGVLDGGSIPDVTFTTPEVATIGMTEEQAIQEYGSTSVSVAYQKVKDIDRARMEGEEDGFIKIIYSTKKYKILGATIVCSAAGEMISEISVAMKAKMTFDMLATVVHPYPSYSFALQAMAAEVYYEKLTKLKWALSILKFLGL